MRGSTALALKFGVSSAGRSANATHETAHTLAKIAATSVDVYLNFSLSFILWGPWPPPRRCSSGQGGNGPSPSADDTSRPELCGLTSWRRAPPRGSLSPAPACRPGVRASPVGSAPQHPQPLADGFDARTVHGEHPAAADLVDLDGGRREVVQGAGRVFPRAEAARLADVLKHGVGVDARDQSPEPAVRSGPWSARCARSCRLRPVLESVAGPVRLARERSRLSRRPRQVGTAGAPTPKPGWSRSGSSTGHPSASRPSHNTGSRSVISTSTTRGITAVGRSTE